MLKFKANSHLLGFNEKKQKLDVKIGKVETDKNLFNFTELCWNSIRFDIKSVSKHKYIFDNIKTYVWLDYEWNWQEKCIERIETNGVYINKLGENLLNNYYDEIVELIETVQKI